MNVRARIVALALAMAAPCAAHAQDGVVATPAEPTATELPLESADASLAPQGPLLEAPLSPEELERLGFGGSAPSVDTNIKIFGFADFSFAASPQRPSNTLRQLIQPHSSFYIGNFNLYLSKNLSENVRTMAEVRFLYAPHGTVADSGAYVVNATRDPSDFNRILHWGGISIQRIYVEWTMFPKLTVRAGQFLTPYGIWNVDHGSPLYIPVTRPYVIGSQLFPEQQTGLEFFGQTELSGDHTLGYHFTLSNGMGPVSEVVDLDENKGVGGRLFWEYRGLGTLRLGGSAFYAQDTSASRAQGLDASGHLTAAQKITSHSKVLSLAADVQWRYKGLHLQAEVVTQQRKYSAHGRIASSSPFTSQPLFPEDYLSWGVYGIAGYGFDVWVLNLMPYFELQTFDQIDPSFLTTRPKVYTVGFNVRPIDALVVKLSYVYTKFHDFVTREDVIQLLEAQIAWAF